MLQPVIEPRARSARPPGRHLPLQQRVETGIEESPLAPRVAQAQPDAAPECDWRDAVVAADGGAAKLFLETVDAGAFRQRLVRKKSTPVIAGEPQRAEAQHFLPVQPAVRAADERAILVVAVAEA